jgi:hypothetical protein
MDNVCDILGLIPTPVPSGNMGMAFDGQYLWVGQNISSSICNIYKVDPANGNVVFSCTAPWPGYMLGMTYDPVNQTLWAVDWTTYVVTEFDPATCAMVSQFAVGGTPRGLSYDPVDDALVIGDTGGAVFSGSFVWYNRNGTPTGRTCSSTGTTEWCMGMEFGPSGYLWVNDDGGTSDINQLDVSGPASSEVTVCAHPGMSNIPEGLTLDADNQVRTTAYYGPSIWTIESGEGPGMDTAYVEIVDVYTDAAIYQPGDDITLTVEWKFVWQGNGSPGWSNPEEFKVGGGVGKEPNGQPRYIQNTMVGPVGPGTYTTDFVFTVPMMTPIGVEGGGGGHIWPCWSGPGQPEQDILIEHYMFVIDYPPQGEWLFWDDGTYENGLSATGPGYTSATGLIPDSYPCVVESIKCFIDDYNNWFNPGDMYVLDDNSGQPWNVLSGPHTVQAAAPLTWVQVAVNVPISQPIFYVGLECTDPGGYGPYVGADTDVPCNVDYQWWGQITAFSWTLLASYGPPFDCFDLSYQAWVNYADGGGEWLTPNMD